MNHCPMKKNQLTLFFPELCMANGYKAESVRNARPNESASVRTKTACSKDDGKHVAMIHMASWSECFCT
jgi:hypothetical protein